MTLDELMAALQAIRADTADGSLPVNVENAAGDAWLKLDSVKVQAGLFGRRWVVIVPS